MDSSRKNLLIKVAFPLLELAENYKSAQNFSRAIRIYCNANKVLQLIIEFSDNDIASKIKFIDVLVEISSSLVTLFSMVSFIHLFIREDIEIFQENIKILRKRNLS